jgi:hypothetical protein
VDAAGGLERSRQLLSVVDWDIDRRVIIVPFETVEFARFAQSIDEKNSIEVVDLVLHCSRGDIGYLHPLLATLNVEILHGQG